MGEFCVLLEQEVYANGGGKYGIVPVVPLVHVPAGKNPRCFLHFKARLIDDSVFVFLVAGQNAYLDPDFHMPFWVADGDARMFECHAICSFMDDEDDPHNEGRQFLAHLLQIVRAFQDDVHYANIHATIFDLFEHSPLAVATREHYPGGSILLV